MPTNQNKLTLVTGSSHFTASGIHKIQIASPSASFARIEYGLELSGSSDVTISSIVTGSMAQNGPIELLQGNTIEGPIQRFRGIEGNFLVFHTGNSTVLN